MGPDWLQGNMEDRNHPIHMKKQPKGDLPNLRFGASRPAETSDFRFQMTTLSDIMKICIVI
jgi:hypothetical protein